MASYDLKRLEIAIQYIRRMSEGKNPVTNRPAPENEVLGNMNVHRCLKFIRDLPLRGPGAVPLSARPADLLLPEAARRIPARRSKNTRPRHNDHTVDARKRIFGEKSSG